MSVHDTVCKYAITHKDKNMHNVASLAYHISKIKKKIKDKS